MNRLEYIAKRLEGEEEISTWEAGLLLKLARAGPRVAQAADRAGNQKARMAIPEADPESGGEEWRMPKWDIPGRMMQELIEASGPLEREVEDLGSFERYESANKEDIY